MRLFSHVQAGRDQGQTVLQTEEQFQAARDKFESRKTAELANGKPFELSNEQLNAARNVLMHGDSFQYIQGDAGTGKTAALEFVREATTEQGWRVLGMATTSTAAKELQAGSGIEAQTVAGFLFDRDNALRLAKADLAQLKDAIAENTALRTHVDKSAGEPDSGHALAVDRAKVRALSFTIDFGKGRYAFDHERGDAYKLGPGLASRVGLTLVDVTAKFKSWERDRADGVNITKQPTSNSQTSKQTKGGAEQGTAKGADKGERATLAMRGADLFQELGKRMIRYEKVGTVETIAARTAWYLQSHGTYNNLVANANRREAEIGNLERTGDLQGRRTLLVMDEASMTGIYDTEKVAALAAQIGARTVFQGDSKQHGSVPAGRAFAQAQELGINSSTLTETRRFDNATQQVKDAVLDVNRGLFQNALLRLDTLQVADEKLSSATADQWLRSYDALKSANPTAEPKIGVVAPINRDRKDINTAIHAALQGRGLVGQQSFAKEHLDNPKLTVAEQHNVGIMANKKVDRLVFRKNYRELGIEKGDVLRVRSFNVLKNQVVVENSRGRLLNVDPARQDYFTPMRLEMRNFAAGAQVEARANISVAALEQGGAKEAASTGEKQTPQLERVTNGTRGKILSIDKDGATIAWSDGRQSALSNNDLRNVDLSYVHTSIKEQGQNNSIELIAISKLAAKVFNDQTAYVTVTRAKDNAIVITSDHETLLENAGRKVEKTTAMSQENASYKFDLELMNIIKDARAARDQGVGQPREQTIEHTKGKHLHAQTLERGRDLGLAPEF